MADDKLRVPGEERVRDFLKLARVARLATSDHSGVPHNIPICFWFDEVAYFYFVIDKKPKRLTSTGLKRIRTIAENPRAALIIDHYEEDWSYLAYVLIHGQAHLVDDPNDYMFALRNLRDPYLDTHVIAKGVGHSVRHLHELFASEPDTLMRWIRSERLKRIKDELADPAVVERPIATIAYDWGFREPAHFSRTFRAAYGVSPRIFRDSIKLTRPRSPDGGQWIAMPGSRPESIEEPTFDCASFAASAEFGDRSRAPRDML